MQLQHEMQKVQESTAEKDKQLAEMQAALAQARAAAAAAAAAAPAPATPGTPATPVNSGVLRDAAQNGSELAAIARKGLSAAPGGYR